VPDPAKAVAEMARMVRPGGIIATQMWDVAGGGLPLAPVGRALKVLGKDYSRISDTAARGRHDISVKSNLVPVGPARQVIAKMAPAELEQLKANLRRQLPSAADGSIAYEAFANAVKGRVAK
jgi:hypothetical protein